MVGHLSNELVDRPNDSAGRRAKCSPGNYSELSAVIDHNAVVQFELARDLRSRRKRRDPLLAWGDET